MMYAINDYHFYTYITTFAHDHNKFNPDIDHYIFNYEWSFKMSFFTYYIFNYEVESYDTIISL